MDVDDEEGANGPSTSQENDTDDEVVEVPVVPEKRTRR
jgi:hypothetical protein